MVDRTRRPCVSTALDAASQRFGVTRNEILSRTRTANLVQARAFVAVHLYQPKTIYTLCEVGRILSRNHKTIHTYIKNDAAKRVHHG